MIYFTTLVSHVHISSAAFNDIKIDIIILTSVMIMYFIIWRKIIIEYFGYIFIKYFIYEYPNIIQSIDAIEFNK